MIIHFLVKVHFLLTEKFQIYLYNKDGSGIVGHALGKCVYPSYNFGLRPPEIVSTPPSTRHTKWGRGLVRLYQNLGFGPCQNLNTRSFLKINVKDTWKLVKNTEKTKKTRRKWSPLQEFSQLPICLFWRRLHNLLQSDFADYSADGLESRYILVVWKSPKNCQKYQNKLESSATKCCIL